jgi:hypothetical protein
MSACGLLSKTSPFQETLLHDVENLYNELRKARRPLHAFALEYQQTFWNNPSATVGHLINVKMPLHAKDVDEATTWALRLLKPCGTHMLGPHPTCVVQWRLDIGSMWRGQPDSRRVLRLVKNIISSGFSKDSCVTSRTLDMSGTGGRDGADVVTFRLCSGDGSARLVAATVVWLLILRRSTEIPHGDPAVEILIESLWNIPTHFAPHSEQAVVAQDVREHQLAESLPVSALKWVGMVTKHASITTRKALRTHLNQMVVADSQHMAAASWATKPEALAKRLRLTGGCSAATNRKDPDDQQEPEDVLCGLTMGAKCLVAMCSFLAGGAPLGAMLREHLQRAGDAGASVVSDEVLTWSWFYVDSLPERDGPVPCGSLGHVQMESTAPEGCHALQLQYMAPLTAKQFHMMLEKAIRIFEEDTKDLDSTALKAKQRPNKETWKLYRDVVQQWDVAMAEVMKKDLLASDFQSLEGAILRNRTMDAEVRAMLSRQPALFHIGLLPTCKAAHQEYCFAAYRSLKVFEADLRADWDTVDSFRQGHQQLIELLRWLELEQRRGQAATVEGLVSNFMERCFPVCHIESWQDILGQLATMAKAWGPIDGHRRMIVLIDFNTPCSRDSARLPELVSALGSLVSKFGESETVVLAWMPNAPKEAATTSPEEDEAEIAAHFKKEGFHSQTRVRMFFSMRPSMTDNMSEMDLWVDGRILSKVEGNFWVAKSELARTRCVGEKPRLPLVKDMAFITSQDPNEDINNHWWCAPQDMPAKYAQRGPGVAEVQLAALLNKVPLLPNDETIIIDPFPYVGDRALATYHLMRSTAMENRGRLRHVVVKPMGVGMAFSKPADFTQQRLRSQATMDWFSRTLVLHEMQPNSLGDLVNVAVYPSELVPQPSSEQLQAAPGAWQAFCGLASMHLLACALRGPKVQILPERLSKFQGAPICVQDAVNRLKAAHEADHEDLLSDLIQCWGQTTANPNGMADSRDPITGTVTAADLLMHESEETLSILDKTKSCHRSVHLLRDNQGIFYIVAANDEVLPVGTHLGGVGPGSVLLADPTNAQSFRWSLPAGDKTWVQLCRNDDAKATSGTLYAIVRDLEATTGATPKMTSYGQLVPNCKTGKHQYLFELPEGHEGHKALAFVPVRPSKASPAQAHDFFASVLHRDTGVGQGVLTVCWRLCHDPINNIIRPVKPVVVTGKRVVLKRGHPVRVAWPA